MSEQSTSGTVELTVPRMERSIRIISASFPDDLEAEANIAVKDMQRLRWELTEANMVIGPVMEYTNQLYALLTFEREVQP